MDSLKKRATLLTTLQDAGRRDALVGAGGGTGTLKYMQHLQIPSSSLVKAPVVAPIESYFTNREPLQRMFQNQTALLFSAIRPENRFVPLCIEIGKLKGRDNHREIGR